MLSASFAGLGTGTVLLNQVIHVPQNAPTTPSANPVSNVFAGMQAPQVAPPTANTPAPQQPASGTSTTATTTQVQPQTSPQTNPNTTVVTPSVVTNFAATSVNQSGSTANQLTQSLTGANGPPLNAQLAAQDLQSYISDLLGSESASFSTTQNLGAVSLGGMLELDGVQLSITATLSQAGWSGTVTISAISATLFPGASFSGSITSSTSAAAVTGTYNITGSGGTGGTYSLSVPTTATMTMNVGEALVITATGFSFTYDPNGAGNQTLATISTATVTSPQFSGFSPATLTNFAVRADGFSFSGFSLTASNPSIGNFITASSATLTVSDFDVSFGYGTNAASLSGTVGLSLTGLQLYPAGGIVQFHATGVTATYNFGSFDGVSPTGQLSIDISGFQLDLGQALQLTTGGTDVILTPDQDVMATIASATLTSPQFAGLGTLTVSNLSIGQTGFTLGTVDWSSTGPVTIGNIVSATGVTLSLSNLSLQYGATPSISGSISVSATGVVLFPSVPLLDINLGTVSGTYNFGDSLNPAAYLQLTIPSLNISLGDALTINLGAVTLAPGQSTMLSVTNATVTANLFSGLPTFNLGSFDLTQTGFTLGSFTITAPGTVNVGSFLSLSSLSINVSHFTLDITQTPVVSGSITVTLGTLTLFPGSSLVTSSFTNLQGSYNFGSSTNPGQFSLTADSFTLSVGGQLSLTASGITLTPGDATLMTIASASLTFTPLNGLMMTITGLQVQRTGFSIATGTATFTSDFTLGSILDLQAPTITLTDIDYVFGSGISGTVGFSSAGVTVDLGAALTASTGELTGNYNLATGQFSATMSDFSLSLAGFASLNASTISLTYSPATDGTSKMLVGATGLNAFAGVGTGSSEVGVEITGGTFALAVYKAADGTITYALDANGAASLVGLPAGTLSVSAGNLDIRSNTAGAVSESLSVGAQTLHLDFTGNEQSAFASGLSISIGTFVSITGDFAFSQFTSGSQTYIAIGADNVRATVAAGGVSLNVSGASLALLINPGASASETTYALVANGGTDSLNGVPDLTLTASGLAVRVRNGLDASTVTGLPSDIATSDGNVNFDFSSLGTGSTALTDLEGTITLAIANFVSISGNFGFQEFPDNGSTFFAIGATGLTITLGTDDTYLQVKNASLGLIIESGTGSNPATYALEAQGSSDPSDTSLVGVTGLTLNGSDILVRVRNGLDVTGDSNIPSTVQTPGGAVTLDFSDLGAGTANLADVEGNLTLSVGGFGTLQGSFGFQSFTDGKTGQSELAIGATATTVTLGTTTTNLTVHDASLGLLIRPGAGSTATTYALEATASSAALNGIPDLTVSATSILVRVRSGLDLSTASGLPTSIQTSGGPVTLDFSGLPAGSSNLIDVEASLTLSVGTFVNVTGNFGFQSYTIGSTDYLEIGGTNISVTLSAGGVSLTLANATLGVIVQQGSPTGYALEIIGSSNPSDTALTGVSGLTLNATNLFVLARNGLDASTLPSALPASIHTSGGNVSLAFAGLGSGSGDLFEVAGDLTLDIAGFVSLQGDFGIEKFTDGSNSDLAIAAQHVSAVLGTSSLNVTVTDASLSLLIVPGTGYALVASGGTDSLNGVPDLTLSTSGLKVLVEQGVDPSTVSGAPTFIGIPGSTAINLDFSGLGSTDTVEIFGHITVAVANFISIDGDFSFTETTAGTLTKILVGASSVSATIGSTSFGVQITGASFGLAIYRDSTATSSTYALQATAPSITILGLPTDTDISLSGSASVSINTTGAAVNETLPGGETINFTDGSHGSANQTNIRSFGGSLTLQIGSIFTLTGDFSFSSTGTGSAAEILIGAANVSTAIGTTVGETSGSDTFTLSNGTLGLVIFADDSTTPGYALTASATATVAIGSALSGSATLTIRRNTTTSGQNVDVTVGSTSIPVVFAADTEVATGTGPFESITVGNASLNIDNTIVITAGSATSTTPVAGASSTPLTSVTITLQNPADSEVLFTISAASATYTTFSGDVTASAATAAGLPARADGNDWGSGDKDLVLTNVSFSIAGGVVTFTAQKIDLQHYTGSSGVVDSFAFTGAAISFYSGSQQLLSLGGSFTFTYDTTNGFALNPASITNLTFSFLGQSLGASPALALGSRGPGPSTSGSFSTSDDTSHTLGPITLDNPGINIGNFSFGFGSGTTAVISATITISAGTAAINASAVSATLTNVSGSFNVNVGIDLAHLTAAPTVSANGFTVQADKFEIDIGSFLTLTATGSTTVPLLFNPTASATQDLISFASLTATVSVGSLSISGTASNFAIEGDGSFLAKTGFSVSLSFGTNSDGSDDTSGTGLPSWLPLQSAAITVQWANFNSDPSHFTLIVSASINFTLFGLTIAGSVTGLVIDPSLISHGQFPITGFTTDPTQPTVAPGFSVSVSGNLFGGTVSGTLIVGFVRFDSTGAEVDTSGNLIGTTTPGVGPISSAFFAGIEVGLSLGGMAGFQAMIGLSSYGLLQIYVSVNADIPIGDTGLFITNLNGGIEFGASFPPITITGNASDALNLGNPAFSPPGSLTTAQWEAQLSSSTAALALAAHGVIPSNPFANLGAASMIIDAGATISVGPTPDIFSITGNILFSTEGQILVIGSATIGNSLTVGVKMYADLSPLFTATNQSTTSISILFLMQAPLSTDVSIPPIVQIYGEVTFSYDSTTHVFQIAIAGEGDFNLFNGLEAELAATLTLTFTPNSFNISLLTATFTVPQIQTAPLGTAAGSLTIQSANGSVNIWGGFLLTPDLSGLQSLGIYASGQVFVKLNTTNQVQTVVLTNGTLTLQPESFELFITGTADFKIDGEQIFELSGTLDFGIANGSMTLFVDASFLLGPNPASPILTFNANGVIFVQLIATPQIPIGFAAKLTLTLGGNLPGVTIGEDWLLVINTTGVDISYVIPAPVSTTSAAASSSGVPTVMGPDYSSSNPLALVSYETDVGGNRTLDIPSGPPPGGLSSYATWTPSPANTPYLIILGRGSLTVANNFILTGNLNIVASAGASNFTFIISANATLTLQANGSTIFSFQVTGGLQLGNTGVAAALEVSLSGGVPGNLGFTLNNATFLLELNTTGSPVTFDTITVSAGTHNLFAEVLITGDLEILGGIVDFNGTFAITVTGSSLTIAIDANITFLGATFVADGFAGIYYDSNPGLALYIQLSLPGGAQGIAPVSALGSNFVISGTFTLQLNTSSVTRYDQHGDAIVPGFSVAVTNLSVYLFGFSLTGSLSISITSAGFGIDIQNLDLNLFGFANVTLSGYYHPNGSFSFTGSAGFQLGDHTFGIGGSISVTISNSGFSASINGWVAAFGVQINGGGSITISDGSVDVYVYIYVVLVPAIHIHTPAVTATLPWWLGGGTYTIWPAINIDTPAVVVSGTAHFHLGSTSPAPTVATVTPPPPPPTPPALAGVDSNGVLTLFLGADVSQRVNSTGVETGPQTAEHYTLTLVSTSSSGDTIQVSALGFQQQFSGVKSIVVPDTESGNDTISIDSGIGLPVTATLGSGNNTVTTGSGAATIHVTGAGSNSIGAANNANITISGSGSNHVSAGSNSTIDVTGNGGNTITINGGGSAPITIAGNGNNTVDISNGGSETITISGTGFNNVNVSGGSPTINVQSTASGGNEISVATGSSSTVTIAGGGGNQLTVSGSGTPTITVTGAGSNFITTGAGAATIYLRNGNNNVGTGAGFATIYDQGTGATTVSGGSGGGVFIGGETSGGAAFSTKGASSLSTNYGNFTVQVSGYSDYSLTNSYLAYGSFTLSITGVHQVTLTAGSSSTANVFNLAGWTGSATLNGAGSNNTFLTVPAPNVTNLNYVLTNTQLQVTGGVTQTITLSDIQNADLVGANTGTNNYTISGWSGGGFLAGPQGSNNTVIATDDIATFTLDDTSLARTGDGTMTLDNIQFATLTGGPSSNTFNVGTTTTNWSGSALLNGEGGNDIYNLILAGTNTGIITVNDTGPSSGDTVNITGPANFYVTSNQVREGTQRVNYSGIAILNITGTNPGLNYNVQSTKAGVSTSIETDGGSSLVDVGSTAGIFPVTPGVLSGIQGQLSVNGGGNLLIDNTGSAATQSGTLTPNTFTGFGMGSGGIEYQNVSTLTINLGSGASTLAINDIDPATRTVVNAGTSSNDTVNASFAGDFNGELDLTGFEHGTVLVAGNFNGTLNDVGPGHLESVQIGSIGSQTGSLTATGRLNVGSIGSMTVGLNLAGTATVSGTLGSLTVGGAVSGAVVESGVIATLSIGSLTSTGVIVAANPADPSQYSANSLGDITNATVAGNLSGLLLVSGNVGSLIVGGELTGDVAVHGALTTLQVAGDVTGAVTESGLINLLTIGGNLAATGTITAVNSIPTVANIATFNIGESLAGVVLVSGAITKLGVVGDVSGTVTESGTIDSLTIGGSLTSTGVITAANAADPLQVPITATTTHGNINTAMVGGNLAGILTVTGNVGSLGVAGSLSGVVTVNNTLSILNVIGDVSGSVTESGMITMVTIDGSLTGTITARNTQDSAQVPLSGQVTLADITTITIGGNLSGTLTVTGNVGSLSVAGSLSGTVAVNNTLGNLIVGGDVSGLVTESGTIALLTIGGSLTSTGTIAAANANDPSQVPLAGGVTVANITTMTVGQNLAGILTVTGNVSSLSVGTAGAGDSLSGHVMVNGTLTTLKVTGDVTGAVTESGIINLVTITGSLTGTLTARNTQDSAQVPFSGQVTLADITTITIGGNLSGTLTVTGNVGSLSVAGSLSGAVVVDNTLNTLNVGGDVSGSVTESGTINLLTIGGSLTSTGTITAANTNDPSQIPAIDPPLLGNINTMTVGGNLAGHLKVTGNLGTLTVGGSLSGVVLVQNTLSILKVTGDVSGSVTESGTITLLTIGGSLTSTGTITAVDTNDPSQVPQTAPIGNIVTFTITHDLAGTVTVSGTLTALTVGGNLSGVVSVHGVLITLVVSGDVSGSVAESGTINLLTIGGSLTQTGIIRAVNAVASLGNIVTLTIGLNFAGTVIVSGNLHSIAIVGGEMTPTGVLTVGSLDSMTIGPNQLSVGQNMAGTITVAGTLGSLRVAGGTPGTIIAGHIGTIAVYGGFGPVVLNVTENGIQRLVEATTPSQAYPMPNPNSVALAPGQTAYINLQFYYESGNLANPQLTIRVANNVSTGADQFDLSLLTYNDVAKFNLARLDAAGVSGIRNVVVEGDLLTSISAHAASFFQIPGPHGTTIADPTPAGVRLPSDHLAGVSIRDFAPDDEIQANTIQAVAFGSFSDHGCIFNGSQAQGEDAEELLTCDTEIVQAADTFRVAFADLSTEQVALFFATEEYSHCFDNNSIVFTVQSVVTANAAGTANITTQSNVARGADTALVTVMPTYDNHGRIEDSVVQTIAIRGDGASIRTEQYISQSITSTGPLGDLILQADQGITNITAPSIFGSIEGGPLTGTIQTTGLRTDPITGVITTVSADIGRVYVAFTQCGRTLIPYLTTTTINIDDGVCGSGSIVSRGNLISQVTICGDLSGVIAVQGNVGLNRTENGQNVRLGGIVINGGVNGFKDCGSEGAVVILGQQLADVTINGGLQDGADYAVEGGILGNLTINGGVDENSVLVSGGQIGDPTQCTTLDIDGGNEGIIAAKGNILFNRNDPPRNEEGGHIFNNVGTNPSNPNVAAINAIFTNNGIPLALDVSPLDLKGLSLILTDLKNLKVNSQGNLTGPIP